MQSGPWHIRQLALRATGQPGMTHDVCHFHALFMIRISPALPLSASRLAACETLLEEELCSEIR